MRNILLNKAKNVRFILGDVRNEVPKLKGKFDRVIMPLPKDADTFLDTAFKVAKKGTFIHLYLFWDKDEFARGRRRVLQIAKRNGRKIKVMGLVRCGQYSPRVFRVCLDLRML
jgi:tRNA (guanine37-N1)-methyltransferase